MRKPQAKPKPRFSWDEIDGLRREEELEANDPGFTVADYAKRYGLPYQTASSQLKRLVARGELLRGKRYVLDSGGKRARMMVYRSKRDG